MDIPGLFALGGAAALAACIWYNRTLATEASEAKKSVRLEKLRADNAEANEKQLLQNNSELMRIFNERSKAIPWLAALAADLNWVQDEREAKHLESKKHPAKTAAESVRADAQEKKRLRVENSLFRYRVALMEHLVPWLKDVDFSDAEAVADQELLEADEGVDPASPWLSKDEWERLPAAERYQRALDRYKNRPRSDWQVGRDFERLVGYQLETQGYKVVYQGAIKGFDDFGRDLIATDWTHKTLLVQCKRWSTRKVIPKAVIFQLFGSAVSYYVERTGSAPADLRLLFRDIEPWLYSTTAVAPRIRAIALVMGVQIKDDIVVEDWPMVKCNIGANGERIYHLPMDQQYDRVMIAKKGECYAHTVTEAESKGFRRAKRWISTAAN
jgi:hypothetical protein